jgi:hypothetical protein
MGRPGRLRRALLIGVVLCGLAVYGIPLVQGFTLIASTTLTITPTSGRPTDQFSADATYSTAACPPSPPAPAFTFNFTWDSAPLTSVTVSTCDSKLTYDTGPIALLPPAALATPGGHEVLLSVTGPAGRPVPNGTATQPYFIVTLSIRPPCASVGDPITIIGAGFQGDIPLPIHLVFVPGAVALQDASAPNGSFVVTDVVPNLPPATYELDATQPGRTPQNTRTAKTTLRVPCFNPILKLVPDLGPPGIVTTALGTGFPPGVPVDFAWTIGVLSPGVATVVTAPDGTFTFEILIFPHDTIGARQLVATHDPKSQVFADAKADFLVVPGSVQPNDFSWRH